MNSLISMKKPAHAAVMALACCAITVLLAASPMVGLTALGGDTASNAAVEESKWTGKVEQKSVGGSMAFVLTVAGQSYLLTPQDKLASLDGKTVSITGTLKDGVITITTIEEVN